MGLYVCDVCGCVENTALGNFWWRSRSLAKNDQYPIGTALCSEHTPVKFSYGFAKYGKWHGKFPKVTWDGKQEVMNRNPGEPAIKFTPTKEN